LDSLAYLRDSDVDAPLVAGDLILVKDGYHYSSPVKAIDKNSGVIVWKFDRDVISNIAIGGAVTYVLTVNAEIFALDTLTGRILGSLKFTPDFPDNFDFATANIYMAADENIVAVYFEYIGQLTIFRFSLQ
jgi:outer membrane protein assembly factor BamB